MLSFTIVSLLASIAALATAAPASDQLSGQLYDDIVSSGEGRNVNPFTGEVIGESVAAGAPIAIGPARFPYNGKFDGSNPGWSCGDEHAEGVDDAPLREDCKAAVAAWRNGDFRGSNERETYVTGTCVLAWVPDDTSFLNNPEGSDLMRAYNDLINRCLGGSAKDYVSNYAYASWDGYGTFSMYRNGDDADGPVIS